MEAIDFARVASHSAKPAPNTIELGVLFSTIEGPAGPSEVLLL